MKTTMQRPECLICLHPAVADRVLVESIQKHTGRLLLIKGRKTATAKNPQQHSPAPGVAMLHNSVL